MEATSSLPANLSSRDSIDEITEETETETLVRVSSFPSASSNQQPRRRVASKSGSFAARPCRQQSFGREIGHAAAETYLLTSLSFKLLSSGISLFFPVCFLLGYRWITRLLALAVYAMLLMPGFLQVAFSYFFSSQVRRSIVYGDQPRNRLDLYLPTNSDDLKPVVIFVTGGAWIIGYKAWGSFLGLQLAERDIIVACLDYRNFPQGTISDMVNDVCQGIAFIFNNIVEFGGDPNKIYLMGQSAGAHISACALFQQAVKESRVLNNYIDSIMEGEKALEQFSPEIILQNPSSIGAVSLLPHIILFHGTADYSIPSDASITFVDTLRRVGAQADLILYQGKTHTDLFLQGCYGASKKTFRARNTAEIGWPSQPVLVRRYTRLHPYCLLLESEAPALDSIASLEDRAWYGSMVNSNGNQPVLSLQFSMYCWL
ncbi:hypothetical protein DH2020_037190 [Rehmannia glutinosa]|uniref:protein-S-isoprenylcysteine alpha-carbonyl methylesterase n=1 Tax=Rehmannia glutinosa TaxID=99300 RepID=A0ABR0V1V0_REHGL